MDPQLSLLMANLGKVSNGDLVLDPFVGSGMYFVYIMFYRILYLCNIIYC